MNSSSPIPAHATARHPWLAVIAVGLATFCVVTTEMLPVGLLTPIAETLDTSAGTAGLVISLPALLAAVFAPLVDTQSRMFEDTLSRLRRASLSRSTQIAIAGRKGT